MFYNLCFIKVMYKSYNIKVININIINISCHDNIAMFMFNVISYDYKSYVVCYKSYT